MTADPGTQTAADAATQPEYSVPALEKALDILELLADDAGGLSQTAIAEATGRRVGQIFRVLTSLDRRGYLMRDRQSGLYGLSTMLFDLAHRHPPLRGLITAATVPMRELADEIRQSCNLSVLDAGRVRVLAQVESPADFGFRVRVGALFPVGGTATGSVLVAGAAEDVRRTLAGECDQEELAHATRHGHVRRHDALQPGITDLVVPVTGAAGTTVAALTVPYIATTFSGSREDDVLAAARRAAERILP
ncbi:IclR family transcriptional regulator [Lysobacter korlensis]|uniref:IclR family transcriptional regulator n=1 Tax=Lysobacter korlensis TaxID=553636 RepID=A0ABV6RZ01_9GAMM